MQFRAITPEQDASQEALFLTIYTLAKKWDKEGTIEALSQRVKSSSSASIHIFFNDHTPVMLLAKEGEKEAVQFLIDKFEASLNHAVLGAALAGHVELVWQLISQGASLNYALLGVIDNENKKNDELKEKLINRGANLLGANSMRLRLKWIAWATVEINARPVSSHSSRDHLYSISRYIAETGEARPLNCLLKSVELSKPYNLIKLYVLNMLNMFADKFESCLDGAIHGAAKGGHIILLNSLIEYAKEKGCEGPLRSAAVCGAKEGKYLDAARSRSEILQFISFIDDLKLRKKLIKKVIREGGLVDSIEIILPKVNQINGLLRNINFDFAQTQSWQSVLHCWFLQGIQLVKGRMVSLDIFIHISSFIIGLSDVETKRFFDQYRDRMPRILYDTSLQTIEKNFQSSFWSSPITKPKLTEAEYVEKREEARIRYETRISN
jgi:hypothetical protein